MTTSECGEGCECAECAATAAHYPICRVCGGPCIETRVSSEVQGVCSDACADADVEALR